MMPVEKVHYYRLHVLPSVDVHDGSKVLLGKLKLSSFMRSVRNKEKIKNPEKMKKKKTHF